MTEPIESSYFNWLCNKVLQVENPTPSLTYWNLLRELHNTEFVWLISGDDNRAEDGKDLRVEFLTEAFLPDSPEFHHVSCSVFEMLLALARRADFETSRSYKEWFWEFIENLGLRELNDATSFHPNVVSELIYNFTWRLYEPDGSGGLFPLRHTENDQRKVEIWYQLAEYLVDQE